MRPDDYYKDRWRAFLPKVAEILRRLPTRKPKGDCTDREGYVASSIIGAWMVHVSKWEAKP